MDHHHHHHHKTVEDLREDKTKERLLAIEDELPIEQILLYRAIARKVKITGASPKTPLVSPIPILNKIPLEKESKQLMFQKQNRAKTRFKAATHVVGHVATDKKRKKKTSVETPDPMKFSEGSGL
eukprot:13565895-Ditylum_brightwellii.AAC.1